MKSSKTELLKRSSSGEEKTKARKSCWNEAVQLEGRDYRDHPKTKLKGSLWGATREEKAGEFTQHAPTCGTFPIGTPGIIYVMYVTKDIKVCVCMYVCI